MAPAEPDADALPRNPAALLARVGRVPITEAMLEADRADGAPANPDGTIHLVHYAAWLVREAGRAD